MRVPGWQGDGGSVAVTGLEVITEAAGNLHRAGLIDYRRGDITRLNREGLVARACECYSVVKQEFERLLPQEHGEA